MLFQFNEWLDSGLVDSLNAVDKTISSRVNSEVEQIRFAVDNLLNAGGKKMRALFALISFELCGKNCNEDFAIKTAAAIELIHNATLLHDDVIDNSNLRRGKQNAKSIYGNKVSVLTGDFVLSVAFSLIIETGSIEAVKLLSLTAKKLAEGEIKQLSLTGKPINYSEYLQIIETKTATLFATACELAAILCDTKEYVKNLREFGYNIGIAFQIVDDILDYEGGAELGKEIGKDFSESKFTLPCIIAMKSGKTEESRNFWQKTFFTQDKSLKSAMQYLEQTDAINQSRDIAKNYVEIAKKNIAQVGERGSYHKLIEKLINFILERNL